MEYHRVNKEVLRPTLEKSSVGFFMPVVLVLRHANPVKKAQQHTKKLEKSSNEWMQANKYNRLVNIYFGFQVTWSSRSICTCSTWNNIAFFLIA